MKSVLLFIFILISLTVFSQNTYKLLFQKVDQKSCMIIKQQIGKDIPDLRLQNFSHDRDNRLKLSASAGIIGFAGIMTISYCTNTDEKFKEDKLGYWGLMWILTAGLVTVQIVL